MYNYKAVVQTSNGAGAAFDGDAYITLVGAHGAGDEVKLEAEGARAAGSAQTFNFKSLALGERQVRPEV